LQQRERKFLFIGELERCGSHSNASAGSRADADTGAVHGAGEL
jgi:hypothetical protein